MEEKGFFDSEEFQEVEGNFLVGLTEDVRNWDSYLTLVYSVYEQGRKDGMMGR